MMGLLGFVQVQEELIQQALNLTQPVGHLVLVQVGQVFLVILNILVEVDDGYLFWEGLQVKAIGLRLSFDACSHHSQ